MASQIMYIQLIDSKHVYCNVCTCGLKAFPDTVPLHTQLIWVKPSSWWY